jgi:hypothetical protein
MSESARLLLEPALVWRAPVKGARRKFTRRGAYREWARLLLRGRRNSCGCESAEYRDGFMTYEGSVCELHGEGYDRLCSRLARWLEWRDRRGGVKP